MDLTNLEECALQLNFVKSCYVLWDESYHKLHLCLTTKEEITDHSNTNTVVTKHLHKLASLNRPDEIHFLKQFKYNSSGKISIEFLKNHIQEQTRKKNLCNIDFEKIEEIFTRIWKDNLIHINDGFRSLGGTSIIALRMSSTMSQEANIEFPELIGILLNNATVDECVTYIKSTVLNIHRDEVINSFEYDCCNSQAIPLINVTGEHSKSVNAEDQGPDSFQSYTYKWHKCRGQIYSDTAVTEKDCKIESDTISRIEVLKTCNLEKCVDASPTVFRYSE